MNNKLVIGVVTYKPNVDLLERLQNTMNAGFSIYIFDNYPNDITIRNFCCKYKESEIRYITCGKNVGLGYGISSVCSQAYYQNYQFLLFFDQDTIFDSSTLNFVNKLIVTHKELATKYSSIVFSSNELNTGINKLDNLPCNYHIYDVKLAINSGSLYYLSNLETIGWHNHSYFVDGVDYEFCLRSSNYKFKNGHCAFAPGLDHVSGQDSTTHQLFGRIWTMRVYPLSRLFDSIIAHIRLITTAFLTRNYTYTVEITRVFIGYLSCQLIFHVINIVSKRIVTRQINSRQKDC